MATIVPDQQDKVLVVDDDTKVQTILGRSLKRFGYDVAIATNGADGLRLAVELSPTVIITDLRMPQMDGHTLVRRLAGMGSRASVIVMSAHGDMQDVVDALRNGAVDYLKKPWTPSELVASVERAVAVYKKLHSVATDSAEDLSAPTHRTSAASAEEVVSALSAMTRPSSAPERAGGSDGTDAAALSAVLEQVRSGEVSIPTASATIKSLRTILREPEAKLDEVVALIERDQRLAAQVLRLSKTTQYTRILQNYDIRTAVTRIGVRQLASLVETVYAQGCFQVRDKKGQELLARIWKFSVARAVAMRALAEVAMMGERLEPETAYLGGLLCDTGASFLLWLAAERVEKAGSNKGQLDIDACSANIQLWHEPVGAAVLHRWSMDEKMVAIVPIHHADSPPAPPNPYWNLQVLAEEFAIQAAGDDPTTLRRHDAALIERCGAEMRIGSSAIKKVTEKLGTEFQGILETLS